MATCYVDVIGNVFSNKYGEEYVVLRDVNIDKRYCIEIEFLKTKSRRIIEKGGVGTHHVKDFYSKNIMGVACIGEPKRNKDKLYFCLYKRWYAMLERCYSMKSNSFRSYGAKGVTVDERWLCFEYFLEDVVSLGGYDEQLLIENKIHLDKDTLIKGNLKYSKEACIFIDKFKNIRYQSTKLKEFVCITKFGGVYYFNSQGECARRFNLTARTIGKVLNGDLKSHKNYRFMYI